MQLDNLKNIMQYRFFFGSTFSCVKMTFIKELTNIFYEWWKKN